MKNVMDGFFLSMQFFSVIPIRKEIPIDEKRLKYAILTLPILGAIIGFFASLLLWLLNSFTPLSPFALSVMLLFYFIFITGGIHLDGWCDTSDAYFSYREQAKRLEIMKDPRIGTFGVLSLLCLLMFRFLFIFETLLEWSIFDYFLLIMIPIFSRMTMGTLLIAGPRMAKNDGLGFLFSRALSKKNLWTFIVYFILLLFLSIFISRTVSLVLILFFTLLITVYRAASKMFQRAFGGLTGDTLGATIEGTETILWMIVWLLHLYAMV